MPAGMKVIIPAVCFRPEQLEAGTFVFKSIRVGFPTAEIVVVINHTPPHLQSGIVDAARQAGIEVTWNNEHANAPLFELHRAFLLSEPAPFFLCDSDVIFWESIEDRLGEFGNAVMAGRYIPRFFNRFARCIAMPRLHTCLLYINARKFRREMQRFYDSLGPESYCTPRPDLITPTFVTVKDDQSEIQTTETVFYDAWSMAYHSFRETARFSDSVNACFDHLTCGSVAHVVGPEYGIDMVAVHQRYLRNPEKIRGLWLKQRAGYEAFVA